MKRLSWLMVAGLVVFLHALAFASAGDQLSDEQKVTNLIRFLNGKSRLEEVFPESDKGFSDHEVQALKVLKGKIGKVSLPHFTSFGHSVIAYFEDGVSVEMNVLQAEPLVFAIGSDVYQTRPAKAFIEQLNARFNSRSTSEFGVKTERSHAGLIRLWVDEARAQISGRDSASANRASGLYNSGSTGSASKDGSRDNSIDVQEMRKRVREAAGAIGLGSLSEPTIRAAATKTDQSSPQAKASGLYRQHPKVTCGNEKIEGLSADVETSYRVSNSVLYFDLRPKTSQAFVQVRKNQTTSENSMYFCKTKDNCISLFPIVEDSVRPKFDERGQKTELNTAFPEVQRLAKEHKTLLEKERLHYRTSELSAQAFMEREKIKYPRTSKLEEVEKAFLAKGTFERLYRAYTEAEAESYWDQAKNGKSASDQLSGLALWVSNSYKKMSPDEFKTSLMNTLYSAGLRSHAETNGSRLDLTYLPELRDLRQHPIVKGLRPFEASDRLGDDGYMLTEVDEARFNELNRNNRMAERSSDIERKIAIAKQAKELVAKLDQDGSIMRKCDQSQVPGLEKAAQRGDEPNVACLMAAVTDLKKYSDPVLHKIQLFAHQNVDIAECCSDKVCRTELANLARAEKALQSGKGNQGERGKAGNSGSATSN